VPMPLPRLARVLFFKGHNTTKFLECFNKLCKKYRLTKEQKAIKLPRYYKQSISKVIKIIKD